MSEPVSFGGTTKCFPSYWVMFDEYDRKGAQHEGSVNAKPAPRGVLVEKAASVLMQVLYAAQCARFDLFCAVGGLAQRSASWDGECDIASDRLCYTQHTPLALHGV